MLILLILHKHFMFLAMMDTWHLSQLSSLLILALIIRNYKFFKNIEQLALVLKTELNRATIQGYMKQIPYSLSTS